MNVTITFGNPFLVTIYTVAMLMIGWAIGAHWGHTVTAAWALLFATIFLLIHDAAMAILLGIATAKLASAGRSGEKHK